MFRRTKVTSFDILLARLTDIKTDVIIHHFFIDFVAGIPWPLGNAPLFYERAPASTVNSFIKDFARLQIAMSSTCFDQGIGSVYPSIDGLDRSIIGPFISVNGFGKVDPPYFCGPFKTNRERYLEHIRIKMDLIENHDLSEDDPVTAYLAQLEARFLVEGSKELSRREYRFYIKHADDKGDQFLTEDNRIKSVIDWEWSVSLSASHLIVT